MIRTRSVLILLLTSAWLYGFGPSQAAAQPVPLGPEIRVDAPSRYRPPFAAHVAAGADGGFEVAWSYLDVDLNLPVFGRHFDANGRPSRRMLVGGGLRPYVQSVTATAAGFEVLWEDILSPDRTVSDRRHLDARGVPDPSLPVRLGNPSVAPWVWQVQGIGSLGGWPTGTGHSPRGIAVQRLTAAGQFTGPVIQLNSRPVFTPYKPVLVALANGGFLAVWTGSAPSSGGSVNVLRARRFSAKGLPLGGDFDITQAPAKKTEDFDFIVAAAAPGGGFAVAWRWSDFTGTITASYLRLFQSDGRPLTPAIQSPSPVKWADSMAFDDAGDLLVLWYINAPGPQYDDLRVQLYDPQGSTLGSLEPVATAASGPFSQPFQGEVAGAGSTWAVVWEARNSAVYDDTAIFLRRFAAP